MDEARIVGGYAGFERRTYMNYKNITVAGTGVLGSQIAYQTAYKGFHVNVYDVSEEVLRHARERLTNLKENYKEDLGAKQQAVDEAFNRISFYTNLAQAVADADVVIEAIPEVVQIKTDFYKELGKVAPKKTIFATNSSTLLPSQFAEATGRPDKFLALHFANSIWKNTTAEIMKHPGTDETVFRDVIEFAKAIGMVALALQKEQPGYILNSLLIPLLEAAQMLLLKEVADVETIDKTWMIATGAPEGPFAILDTVGIPTAYNITLARATATGSPEFEKMASLLKTQYLDKGKLGRVTGQGFYTYPNPSFASPGFVRNR
jgi:3-hydroxybutyryl-CoA dehydrogenase